MPLPHPRPCPSFLPRHIHLPRVPSVSVSLSLLFVRQPSRPALLEAAASQHQHCHSGRPSAASLLSSSPPPPHSSPQFCAQQGSGHAPCEAAAPPQPRPACQAASTCLPVLFCLQVSAAARLLACMEPHIQQGGGPGLAYAFGRSTGVRTDGSVQHTYCERRGRAPVCLVSICVKIGAVSLTGSEGSSLGRAAALKHHRSWAHPAQGPQRPVALL
jgi:hypothetical protein